MNTHRLPDQSGQCAPTSVFWFTTLFAVISYAAISMRAVLSPFEANSFLDSKRFLSAAGGACILWLAVRDAERQTGQGPRAQIMAVLNVSIPGALCLFLAREAWDVVVSGEFAQRLALNLRWMLTWIGYFAAAVAAFFALSYYRQLQAIRADGFARPHPAGDAAVRSVSQGQPAYEVADLDFDPRKRV